MRKRSRGVRCVAAACVLLFMIAALGGSSLYMRWRWLGSPSFREVLFNLSDGYSGHDLNCMRGSRVTYEGILGDSRYYGNFVKKYGEPNEEQVEVEAEAEDSLLRLTAVYDDYILVYLGREDRDRQTYMLREMTILSDQVELPVSGVSLGSPKWKADLGYRYNETEMINGEMYYEESHCMMCGMDRFYISLQFEGKRVSGIHVRMETAG